MTRQDMLDIRSATYKMCRISVNTLLMTTIVGLIGSFVMIHNVEAATIKTTSTIDTEVVHLGDVFADTQNPDTVLGNSPELGKDMVLNATTLKRIANNYHVAWQPQSSSDQVIIRRSSQTVDQDMIMETLKSSLTEKGVTGNFTLSLTNENPIILLPGNVDATVEIASFNYTPGRDVFTAKLASPSVSNPLKTLEISGLINRTVSVPTLSATARKGDIISASDIAWVDLPERNVTKDTLLDADEIIGKTPQRVLTSGRIIRSNEVADPQLVSRGDDVTILYKSGGMILSAKGKSMQNGSEGDLIRVTNLSSARSMSAQVTGDRVVTVE